jgi:hypothetical protein
MWKSFGMDCRPPVFDGHVAWRAGAGKSFLLLGTALYILGYIPVYMKKKERRMM